MKKLSPLYRNDSEAGLDDEIKQYLDKNYLSNLRNKDQENPKIVVVFSGGNAVGKTTISRLIERELKGLVLENDEVKRNILAYKPELDRSQLNRLTWQYTMYLYKHLDDITKNGLVVRDGVIDWYYDRILPIFKQQAYELFIIGFDISYEKTIELIKKRGDTPTVKEERFYTLIKDHMIHTRRFRSEYMPDIMLDDNSVFDHDLVLSKLRDRISALNNA